jgi:hypothetical protein
VLALMESLAARPSCEAWCVPVANPDGRLAAEADARDRRRRFRRHNARGVDLNRNFACGFDARHWLTRALPSIYACGAAPFSEPESAALRDLAAAHVPARARSLHAFGGWIFWPWSHTAEPPADATEFARLAEAMRGAMRRPYRASQLGRWARWFAAHGTEIDHLYAAHGTRAFLMEVSRGGAFALRPASWTEPFAWFNPPDVEAEVADAALAARVLIEAPV